MNLLKYSMMFLDNQEVKLPHSFSLKPLNDLAEFKADFNQGFVKNRQCRGVIITIVGNGVYTRLISGFVNDHVVIIDMDTRAQYTAAQFSAALDLIQPATKNVVKVGTDYNVQFLQ